jgi:hypothetical protein
MASTPVASAGPAADVEISIAGGQPIVVSPVIETLEWCGAMNGGYTIKFKLVDANFAIMRALNIEHGYQLYARSDVITVKARLRWASPVEVNQTEQRTAFVAQANILGDNADCCTIEFVAIDPPSWYLNCGKASGKVYRGRVSDAIRSCINEYAPRVAADVTQTTDSDSNRWWMMRQDPRTFISSLLTWSTPLTPRRGPWLVSVSDFTIKVKEQLEYSSQNVGFYRLLNRLGLGSHIRRWQVVDANSFNILNTKVVTYGLSAVSGRYLDRVGDTQEQSVVAKDSTTPNKYKPAISTEQSFTRPPDGPSDGPTRVGYTSVPSVPEIYSGGELGLDYASYVDGIARDVYYDTSLAVRRACFRSLGHGIYSDTKGLGVDTITIECIEQGGTAFFLHGNWILYGFRHKYRTGSWITDLYCYRRDHDATAVAVPT